MIVTIAYILATLTWLVMSLLEPVPGAPHGLFFLVLGLHVLAGLSVRLAMRAQGLAKPLPLLRLALFLVFPLTGPAALCTAAGSALRSAWRARSEDPLKNALWGLSTLWRVTGAIGAAAGVVWGLAVLHQVAEGRDPTVAVWPWVDPLAHFEFFHGGLGYFCRYAALAVFVWVALLLIGTHLLLGRHRRTTG